MNEKRTAALCRDGRGVRARRLAGWIGAGVLAAGLQALAVPAQAQDKPVTLRYASNAPPKSPWAVQIERFAKAAAEESRGTITVEPFLGGQLGNEQDTIQQVARGRIDMTVVAAGAASLIAPEIQVGILPFYFRSVAEGDCVLDKVLARPFATLLEARGLKLLGYGEVGSIDLVGKRSFAEVKDLNGAKAATYSKVQSVMWSAVGANSSFVGVPEWASSLQTGLIDTVATIASLYVPSGTNKIAPVLTRLGMWNTFSVIVISKTVFDRMSPAQREALQRAIDRDPVASLRAEIRGLEGKLREAHVAGGGQMVQASPEQLAAWRAKVQPSWPEMVKAIGGQGADLLAKVEAARGTCPAP